MSQETTTIHIRLDEALKNQATAALAQSGLTLSEGVRVFLGSVVKEKGIPAGYSLIKRLLMPMCESWYKKH